MKLQNLFKKNGLAALSVGVVMYMMTACGSPAPNENTNTTTSEETTMTTIDGQIAHYVLFWLKEGLSEEEVDNFANFFEELKTISSIKSLHYGRPVATTPRPPVDNTFTYNLVVFFDTMEELDDYENHPIHLEAIEKYSQYWEKVVVHDSRLK